MPVNTRDRSASLSQDHTEYGGMRLPSVTEEFFPDRRFFEYYLQRLRIVLADRVPALRVIEIRDVSDSADPKEFPSVEVVTRIVGLKLRNPATGHPLMSSEWLRRHFESWPSQESYWLALADHIAASIPLSHPEARLRKKFMQIKSGAPGDLPARADLFVWYQQLITQLVAAKKWLAAQSRRLHGSSEEDKRDFLKAASNPVFWWAHYVADDEISLEQIAKGTPQSTAKQILALKYGVEPETIRCRLFRKA